MKRHLMVTALLASLGFCSQVNAGGGVLLYSEDFNSVTLGDSVNERVGTAFVEVPADTPDTFAIPNAFTHTAAGWTVDNNWNNFGNPAGDPQGGVDLNNPEYASGDIVANTGMFNQGDPDNGVAEWEGWSFARKDFWVEVAGGQDRELFTNATGNVAVADGDEYDDMGTGRGGGYYNTGMTTDNINISAYAGQPLTLRFDSSWRPESFDDDLFDEGTDPETITNQTLVDNWKALDPVNNTDEADAEFNNQTAVIWASYDGGAPQRIEFWDSNSASGVFKGDAPNENLAVNTFVPGGATNLRLSFGYLNAANDWWWALDNLELKDFAETTTIWSEDFEGVTLGDSVNERTVLGKVTANNDDPDTVPRPDSFTNVAPAGWSVDNSLLPFETVDPVPNNNIGSFDMEGWNFVDLDFWTFVDQQGREEFAKASGPFAVADGDEWDDLGDPDQFGEMNTLMESPVIAISGEGDRLVLSFDSSWRAEDAQQVTITADFGSGPEEILHWSSDSEDPDFHDDNTNESVSVTTAIPGGATTVQYALRYQGSDDWWWAVDNIQVNQVPEPTSLALAAFGLLGLGVAGGRRR